MQYLGFIFLPLLVFGGAVHAYEQHFEREPARSSAIGSAPLQAPATSLVQQTRPQKPVHETGPRESLYSEASFQSITSDRRLHKVGDLVTVMIVEDASATSTADTGSNRDAGVGASVTTPAISKGFGVSANNDFSATGRTQRAGRLLGQLTVTVRDLAPNGDLQIGGEQVLEINGERQVIRLDGRVRPRDITELNTVLSSRVADARISFAGDGVLGERQKPGWWHKLLTLFGI